MYHQLSRATGRLVVASHLQSPLFPVAPVALQRVDPTPIQYTTSHLSTVSDSATACSKRKLIPGTNIPYGEVPESMKKKQELFQKDNGVPVFLKGGPFDVFLYRLTMGLCMVGVAGFLQVVYENGFKKK